MRPTKTKKTKTPKNPDPTNTETATLAENPVEQVASKPTKGREGKRILSVAIPDKLARQLKLLCNVEGTTASAVVIAAVQRAVNKRLGAALESIKPDVEA